jgi:hypothetical protein
VHLSDQWKPVRWEQTQQSASNIHLVYLCELHIAQWQKFGWHTLSLSCFEKSFSCYFKHLECGIELYLSWSWSTLHPFVWIGATRRIHVRFGKNWPPQCCFHTSATIYISRRLYRSTDMGSCPVSPPSSGKKDREFKETMQWLGTLDQAC